MSTPEWLEQLNPIKWIKDSLIEINKIPIGYIISLVVTLILLLILIPEFFPNLILFILIVLSILISGKALQKIIDEITKEKNIYEILNTLSVREKELIKEGIKNNTNTIYIDVNSDKNEVARALVSIKNLAHYMGSDDYNTLIIRIDLWKYIKKYYRRNN
jgi:hypothetical protein